MFRMTVERYDEVGRVISVEHKYQEANELAIDFVNSVCGWGIKWDIEADINARDEDDEPKRLCVWIEEMDEKGHLLNHVQLY